MYPPSAHRFCPMELYKLGPRIQVSAYVLVHYWSNQYYVLHSSRNELSAGYNCTLYAYTIHMYGHGLIQFGPVRPGAVRLRSGAAGYGHGLFHFGPARACATSVGYGRVQPGTFLLCIRPGTARECATSVGYGRAQ